MNASYERSLRPLLAAMGHPEWYDALTDDRLRQNVEEREEWAARVQRTLAGTYRTGVGGLDGGGRRAADHVQDAPGVDGD